MVCIYGSHHIPTSRNAKGHRACRTQAGFFMGHEEVRRSHREGVALVYPGAAAMPGSSSSGRGTWANAES